MGQKCLLFLSKIQDNKQFPFNHLASGDFSFFFLLVGTSFSKALDLTGGIKVTARTPDLHPPPRSGRAIVPLEYFPSSSQLLLLFFFLLSP